MPLQSIDKLEPAAEAAASRREFLGKCASAVQIAAVGGLLAPLLSSCGPARIATTARDGNRLEANVALLVADRMSAVLNHKGPDGKDILLVRESPTSYIALSMKCTHKGCAVAPPEDGVMICPCHASEFDLSGTVLKAPATEPLKRYVTSYDSDTRVVTIKIV